MPQRRGPEEIDLDCVSFFVFEGPVLAQSLHIQCNYEAFAVQGRQVFILHLAHSKMNQWGPEWHMLQFQRIKVVSDLIILKLCSHFPGLAILNWLA